MVQQQHVCSSPASRSRPARSSGPAGQVEGPPRLLAGQARRPPRRAVVRAAPSRSTSGSVAGAGVGAITWTGRPPRRRTWCAAPRGGATISREGAAQGADVERARRGARRPACCRAALPGSSRSRNQRRSWAKESGRSPSRGIRRRAAAPGELLPRASAASIARRERGDRRRLEERAQRQLDAEGLAHPRDRPAWRAASGRRARRSCRGRRPARRRAASAQISASTSSTGRRGAAYALRLAPRGARAPAARGGRPCRWASAAARRAPRTPPAPCSSGSAPGERRRAGSAAPAEPSPAAGRRRPPAACRPAASSPRHHHRLAHRRVRRERRLDLAQLDAEAADLHLVVDAAEVLDGAVRQPAREVAGPVEPRPGARAERIGDEAARPSAPAGRGSRAPDLDAADAAARPARRPAPAAGAGRARGCAVLAIGRPIGHQSPRSPRGRSAQKVTSTAASVGP